MKTQLNYTLALCAFILLSSFTYSSKSSEQSFSTSSRSIFRSSVNPWFHSSTAEALNLTSMVSPGDEDEDGVPDFLDKCPHTPPLTFVDANGCPIF